MPYRCTVTQDVIGIVATGEASLEEAFELIDTIASSSRCDGIIPILVDLRAAQYRPTLKVIRSALKAARDSGAFADRKIALVTKRGVFHGIARMTQACAHVVGLQMALFEDIDAAKAWMAAPDRRP